MTDPGHAVEHTFAGHETGIERYTLGTWVWDHHTTVEEFIIERLRAKGESVPDFVRRIQARADTAQRAAELVETAHDR